MIGHYVHHHGTGHATRAVTLLHALDGVEVTGLSSLPRPAAWSQLWLQLEHDADGVTTDTTAGGTLHWAPRHHAGLRSRMATISRWIEAAAPELVVVDTSVEVATLCRLHGVPVVTLLQPGDRTDRAHAMGLDLAERIVAPWPADVAAVVRGVDPDDPRLVHVGALSRFDDRERVLPAADGQRRVVVLSGAGGTALTADTVRRARESAPGWRWTVLGGPEGTWVDDPWDLLCAADVVVTHAGQNALAEVAAARRPAVVVPQERPHEEQRTSAAALAADGRLPVVTLDGFPEDGWAAVLDRAARLDGERWSIWNDGKGAHRLAQVVLEVAGSGRV